MTGAILTVNAGSSSLKLRVIGGDDAVVATADLHDTVIQRLFATGLALQGTVRSAGPEVAERIQGAVGELDETIREIRSVWPSPATSYD
ncbi:MAG: histidine kinase, partial [Acidimicrobiales bacterium]